MYYHTLPKKKKNTLLNNGRLCAIYPIIHRNNYYYYVYDLLYAYKKNNIFIQSQIGDLFFSAEFVDNKFFINI